MPSTVLQRRPDVAAAERAVASANAQIGIARFGLLPNFGSVRSVGNSASRVGDLFSASSLLWSLGLSVAQVVFDGGAIGAGVDAARPAHEAAVARYRQTVLAAFQSVEDQLTAGALAQQELLRREASWPPTRPSSSSSTAIARGRSATPRVVTAQASALNARRAVLQVQLNRQTAAVALIQAWAVVGGGVGCKKKRRRNSYASGLLKGEKLYNRWFMSPIPPKSININYPLNAETRDAFANPSSKGI